MVQWKKSGLCLRSPPHWFVQMRLLVATLFVSAAVATATKSTSKNWKKVPQTVWTQSRRVLNFNGLFGSAVKSATPYDRIAGHPVFSVTTSWGSTYMNMEKLSDLNEVIPTDGSGSSSGSPQSLSEEQNEMRMVALYFMDPDDAIAVHSEMKQLEQLEKADLRLTSFSLARALRYASNLGKGMPTGVPVNALDGKLKSEEGATLRYKIVPSKRQLYYAARCTGKERVGLFSENPAEDAQMAVVGNSALEGMNLVRRRDKRERKTPKSRNAMQMANAHMEGYTGIPVFYAPEMRRELPLVKRIVSGVKYEVPLFFNYEDMMKAWDAMRKRNSKQPIPRKPSDVEVFNLWDVLTSMDRDIHNKRQKQSIKEALLEPFKTRFSKPGPPQLESITFVPSSRSCQYKESITARGNGKARLRPMR